MKKNKQMDEMERMLLLRSQAYGYRAAVLALALLVLYKSTLALVKGTAADPLPAILMGASKTPVRRFAGYFGPHFCAKNLKYTKYSSAFRPSR